MVLMSDNRGALVSVKGSSDKSVAGINVKQAFFAPAISMSPFSGPPPLTKIESITRASLALCLCLIRGRFGTAQLLAPA
jgi:hypothetical protein